MIYKLDKFGTVYATAQSLPQVDAVQSMGTGVVLDGVIAVPSGGVFNPFGTYWRPPGKHLLTVQGAYSESTRALLQTEIETMRGLLGVRNKLWMYEMHDEAERWRYARLIEAKMRTVPGTYPGFRQGMELTFDLEGTCWNGAVHSINAKLPTLTAWAEFECPNAGNGVVRDIIITLTGHDDDWTVWSIANNDTGHESRMDHDEATIGTGEDLVIDCGALTIELEGVDDYAGFSLNTTYHKINEWLRLQPGTVTVFVRRNAGGDADCEATIAYYDAWV